MSPGNFESIPINRRFGCVTSTTDDPWVFGRTFAGWNEDYQQLKPRKFRARTTEAWIGPIQIAYQGVEGPHKNLSCASRNSIVFYSLLPNSDLCQGTRIVPADTVLVQRFSEERMTCSRQCQILFMTVDHTFLQQHAVLLLGRQVFETGGGGFAICANDPESAGAFQRAAVATFRSLLTDPASADDAQRRTLMQQSLMRALMNIIDRAPANRKGPRPSTRTYIVNRAIEFIEAKIADQITVLDVCSAVRVCERTLHYSFTTVLGVTPTQYLRATRLNRVRHELLSSSQRTIESIATQWGFRHMGRFAQYYHATFGHLPSNRKPLTTEAEGELFPNTALDRTVDDALPP